MIVENATITSKLHSINQCSLFKHNRWFSKAIGVLVTLIDQNLKNSYINHHIGKERTLQLNKFPKEDFNRLLNQYKTLSVERLELENEILRSYEVLSGDHAVTITSNRASSDKFKSIMALRKRLNVTNQEMKKIDQKILELFENS